MNFINLRLSARSIYCKFLTTQYILYEPKYVHFILFFKDFIYFLERVGEGDREGKKHQCVVASHVLATVDLVHNPGMCPDWELNWRPFDSQAGTLPLSHTSQGLHM